jgi:N-methylhydantoinase B
MNPSIDPSIVDPSIVDPSSVDPSSVDPSSLDPGSVDPISVEIIQRALQASADEMFAAMRKTAMSAVIYEVLDMGTGITDADGELASSGAGIPAFVGVLDKSVRRVRELHGGAGEIRPGDIFLTNDPYYGGVTHLNDNVLVMPVFAAGELVAWSATIAHWNDVGGMTAGSFSPEAREIWQEGLRIPAVRVIEQGRPVRAVIDILKVNSRLPEFLVGDFWAGVAAVRIGAERIQALVAKYGKNTFLAALRGYLDYGRAAALRTLAGLPHGRFEIAEEQDSGVVYRAVVEISDEAFLVDLRDNPDQDPGPNNTTRDETLTAVQMIFKNIGDPHGPTNGGSFAPVQLLTRPGSVFDAREPAAMGIYYEVSMRLYDLLWRCLAPHLGERLPAGHFSSVCGTVIGGPHPDTGRHFTIVEPEAGGWGADAGGDGNNALFSGFHGETFNCPVEVAEARYGLYVDQLALNGEDGGEGRQRGGKGIVLDYRVRADGCFLTASYSRHVHKPWALAGGCEGSSNYIELRRADGRCERHAVVTALRVDRDDVIRIVTANGGGYGEPRQRSRAAVAADLRGGYLTAERARAVYGWPA